MKIAIIGAGAAGFFAAINIKELAPVYEVTIFESGSHSLAKVAITGGGRCNLTNTFAEVKRLSEAYPRGEQLIKRAFKVFDYQQTYEWFENHGVALVSQDDECVFPLSQSAQQVVDMLVAEAKKNNIEIKHSHKVELITALESGYELSFFDAKLKAQRFDAVMVTSGGQAREQGFDMFRDLDIKYVSPVPSLFSFNLPGDSITQLMGTVVDNVRISIAKSKFSSQGTLLITHWGMSGPAVLKLSSYGARLLAQRDYHSSILVNWCSGLAPEQILEHIQMLIKENKAKKVTSVRAFNLPQRLWNALLEKSGISPDRRFAELGSKGINRFVDTLSNDEYKLSGQTRFRDEFVTCGGVALSELHLSSSQSRRYKNLFFAGEVLDVDAITGGFNLQAAWSTAYLIAKSITNA